MTNAHHATVLNANVAFDDAHLGIHEECIRDDQIQSLSIQRHRRLPHAIADDLATAKLHLIAIATSLRCKVTFDFDDEFRVGQPHTITDRGTKEFGVLPARESECHDE